MAAALPVAGLQPRSGPHQAASGDYYCHWHHHPQWRQISHGHGPSGADLGPLTLRLARRAQAKPGSEAPSQAAWLPSPPEVAQATSRVRATPIAIHCNLDILNAGICAYRTQEPGICVYRNSDKFVCRVPGHTPAHTSHPITGNLHIPKLRISKFRNCAYRNSKICVYRKSFAYIENHLRISGHLRIRKKSFSRWFVIRKKGLRPALRR
jgi:hypothetical protein